MAETTSAADWCQRMLNGVLLCAGQDCSPPGSRKRQKVCCGDASRSEERYCCKGCECAIGVIGCVKERGVSGGGGTKEGLTERQKDRKRNATKKYI